MVNSETMLIWLRACSGGCAVVAGEKQLVMIFSILICVVAGARDGKEPEEALASIRCLRQVLRLSSIKSTLLLRSWRRNTGLSARPIRINGLILLSVKETACRECGELCGDDVDCRVWVYEGAEYTEPPKALIINAILKGVYGGKAQVCAPQQEYKIPENLRRFFAGLEKNTE